MDFENFAIQNADTVEEYRESLQAVCSGRGLSASRLKKMGSTPKVVDKYLL